MIKEEKSVKKTLRISIKEAASTAASAGFGDSFIVPFAEAIKANAFHIGVLSAFSGLLAPLSQHWGNRMQENNSRKKIMVFSYFWTALFWIPLALIPILYLTNSITSSLPWMLILIYSLISIFSGLYYPAWFSAMGDIVPEHKRGKYFAKRNVYAGAAGVIVAILASIFIKQLESAKMAFIGFFILFILAFVFRVVSYIYIKKQYSPDFRLEKKYEFSFISFIKRFDNYGKFAIYNAFFNFAIMVASPFFGFYLLTQLGYHNNLFLYTLISISPTIFTLIFSPIAGKFSDKYGNYELLVISNIFFIISPIVWLISNNIVWLILSTGIVAGIGNAALALAVSNYTLDSVSKEKRSTCIAYTNILIGIGIFVGSILGGTLLNLLQNSSYASKAFFIVFILAALLRLVVAVIFLPGIKEVKKVKKLPYMSILHPIKTIHHELHGFGMFVHHNKKGRLKINKV